MNLLLIASTLAALQVERATAPSFRGEGDGKLRSFRPGEYVLRVRITDETTGEVAERESPFTVRAR